MLPSPAVVLPSPRLTLLVLTVGVSACDRYDLTGVEPTACPGQRILDFLPSDGATDVYGGGPFFVDLNCPEPQVELIFSDDDGPAAGRVTAHHGDSQLRFWPDRPLALGAAHEARLVTPVARAAWAFTTGGLGAPVGGASDRALALQMESGVVLDPAGLRAEAADALAALNLVVALDDVGDARLGRWRGEVADGAADGAVPAIPVDATFDDPVLRLELGALEWSTGLVLHDSQLRGALGDVDGGGFSLAGRWDLRESPLDPDEACETIDVHGGEPCQPCPDGPVACAPLLLVQVNASDWAGTLP